MSLIWPPWSTVWPCRPCLEPFIHHQEVTCVEAPNNGLLALEHCKFTVTREEHSGVGG